MMNECHLLGWCHTASWLKPLRTTLQWRSCSCADYQHGCDAATGWSSWHADIHHNSTASSVALLLQNSVKLTTMSHKTGSFIVIICLHHQKITLSWKDTHGWRLMMLRMSTMMDRSFIETAASRQLCGQKQEIEQKTFLHNISYCFESMAAVSLAAAVTNGGPHLDVPSGPHWPDCLQVLVSAAQHHTHGVMTLRDLRESLAITQSSTSVAR